MPLMLDDRQRFDWLRLIRTEGVGPRTFQGLLNRFGGASAALDALPELSRQAGRPVTLAPVAEIERELALTMRLGCRLLARGEKDYPIALAATPMAPPLLVARGNVAALARPMVAIVGSRNASGLGVKFAERLAAELAEAGIVVVSGLARGIDAAAHRASLRHGTVAVLAGGQGRIYPPQHAELVEEIIAAGAAVSESPFEMEPRGRDFPRRNRIVAGLSLATVVVEAARKSGSLITANMAFDAGREVFAVPGSPLDPRAEGTNDLLHQQKARLCRGAEDVLAEVRPMIGRPPEQGLLFDGGGADEHGDPAQTGGGLFDELEWLVGPDKGAAFREPADDFAGGEGHVPPQAPPPAAGPAETASDRVLALLGVAAIEVDDLVRQTGLPARAVKAALLDLELGGMARADPAGGYSRR